MARAKLNFFFEKGRKGSNIGSRTLEMQYEERMGKSAKEPMQAEMNGGC